MSEDRAAVPGELGFQLRLWCEKHEAPFIAKGYNAKAAVFLMMDALNKKVAHQIPTDADAENAANAYLKALTGEPLCCQLSDEDRAEVLERTPTTTGISEKDEEIALMLAPNAQRERHYPKPGSYTRSTENGADYYMNLGELEDGFMIALLTEGHPRHQRGPDDACTVLHVDKVATEKEARKRFREWLNEKSWLRDDTKPS